MRTESATAAPSRTEATPAGALAWLGAALLVAAIALAAAAAVRWPVPLVAPAAGSGGVADAKPGVSGREALLRFLRDNPRNGRAWVLLGLADLEAERWAEGAASFEKAVQASPNVAADPSGFSLLAEAVEKLSDTQIFLDDTPALTPIQLRTKCRRLHLEHRLDLVIVDYLQLMTGDTRTDNRVQEVSSFPGLKVRLGS